MSAENERIKDLVNKLQSPKKNDRYMACQYLRAALEISPEAISALQHALQDPEEEVRQSAKAALNVHLPPPPKPVERVQESARQISEVYSSPSTPPAKDAHFTYSPVITHMPNISPGAPEYILNLEKRIMVLEVELGQAIKQINELRIHADEVNNKIPQTNLISQNYLTRAFAVWGHEFVAGLIIAIPFSILYFLFFILWVSILGN